ncbi:MAG: MaoC family dehydratase [Cytophagia bacterium]|nr:MAG: MaoC family dehydratase [Cytophagales bacterium]TAG00227.1 MAG: MaoC family dehydratase [Cytophagia bacterium]TAG46469.1 MAG: MaoC family dehydratase [Cytophagia bacterium]
MLVIQGKEELFAKKGQDLGTSEWLLIDQTRINAFADATGDHQFIHVNPEMAKFTPMGTTIAHGFLTLSLMPVLLDKIWQVNGVKMGINYGTNKVRFASPVLVNSKIRLKATLLEIEEVQNGAGVQITVNCVFEIEGQEKPACIAESLVRLYF